MRKLNADDLVRESEVKKRTDFTDAIKQRYGESIYLPASIIPNPKDADKSYDLPFDEVDPKVSESDIVDDEATPIHPMYIAYILMNDELLLPQGWSLRMSKLIRRSVDSDGKVIVNHNGIPVLSTIL